jgi:hypothetical protein
MYPSQWYAPPERAPHWQTFWEVWNRAVRLIRTIHPKAVVVGPSAAPGPGIPEGDPTGWLPQKQWLQAFLIQAHANGTLPDVLSWHDYTGDPAMATSMQSELRAWMTEQHIPMLPMGYNEIVDSVHAQSAGYHVATSVALGDTQADHAALGCWAEPSAAVDAPSTCWDGSLDGLLDPDSNFSARPAYHALRWVSQLPPVSVAVVTPPQESRCMLAASAGVDSSSSCGSLGCLTAVLGRWGAVNDSRVELHLPFSTHSRNVTVERLPGCVGLSAPCPGIVPPDPVLVARVEAGAANPTVVIRLDDAEAARVVVTLA